MIHLGDITKISGYDAPMVDCIVGGSPCQDLSVAGLRKGLQHESLGDGETTRSGLFMEQIRIAKEMRESDIRRRLQSGGSDEPIRPRYMLWENVPGSFSSNKGEDFRVVLEEMARVAEKGVTIPRPPKKWTNSGAIIGDGWSIAWRVFDAQFWGVPQRRKRICLLADFDGYTAAEIVFNEDKQHGCTNREDSDSSVRCVGEKSRSEVQPICESLSGNTEQSRETWQEPTTDAQGSFGASCAFTMQDREGKPGGGKGALIAEDIASTLRTNNYQYLFQPSDSITYEWHSQDVRAKEIVDGISPTISAGMGMGGANTTTPMLIQSPTPFRKTTHPKKGGYQEWEQASINDTLNVFDTSETRTPTVVVEPTYTVDMGGGKSACDILEDKSPTLCTTHYGEPAVVYDARGNGDGVTVPTITGDHQKSISDYTSIVMYQREFGGQVTENPTTAPTLEAAMGTGGNNQPIICHTDYSKTYQDVCGTITAQSHPGSYTGQDAYNDMFVVGKEIQGVDLYNQQLTGDKAMAIRATKSDNEHIPCVVETKPRYIVRRLTPLECERLQGFPDGWTDIGEWVDSKGKIRKTADSNRYKACGNSIALPSWRWVMKRICANYERPATLASLFDGMGGFPLIWEQINGKGSCLWASEIEDFPIAVTTRRFR